MTNKIDPIGFGCLISKVAALRQEELYHGMVLDFHDLVLGAVIDPVVPQPNTVLCSQLDTLLAEIQNGYKIEAIKAYRTLTNAGLKEAKDAVEKYWPNQVPSQHAVPQY
jgi:Ribosomal protein L7/L12 C-terminal domain